MAATVFAGLFNGTAGISLVDAKLEGLHYVHVSEGERYTCRNTVAGVAIPALNMAGADQGMVDGRYAQGLLLAPSTRVYTSTRDAIMGAFAAGNANAELLAKFVAQLCVASCVATGTEIRAGTGAPSVNLDTLDATAAALGPVMNGVVAAYRAEFPTCADATAVSADIRAKMSCTLGFEGTNEAFAAFYHTNHHNGASARFSKGIGYMYVAAQAYLNLAPAPIQVDGVGIAAAFPGTNALIGAIMRNVIHDADHRGRALMVYMNPPPAEVPITDHNRFSFSNAPAGVSHVSGAHAILSDAASLVHASYAAGVTALATINGQIEFSQGMDRFRYSPFAGHLLNTPVIPLPAGVTAALADAGALADIAQDVTYNTILTYLTATSFQAVAVRKHSTPAARARARRYLDIQRAVAAQKSAITANDPNVANAMQAAIAAEIAGIVI